MLPSSAKLDSGKRDAFIEGYVNTAVEIAAGGAELASEVLRDLGSISHALVDVNYDLNEAGEPLLPVMSGDHLTMLGRITALQSQSSYA